MKSRRCGVAIIGAGVIGAVHFRAATMAGAHVQGVADATPEISKEVAEKSGLARAYASPFDAIADSAVDVIHVCTPNASHREFASAALSAGKHVICEKPLATTVADAESLAKLARSSGLTATIPFIYRYHPMVREARARIQNGELGDLQLLHGSYLQDWLLDAASTNWRVDVRQGGASRAFADIGSHWCDLVEWITGERFAEVVATLQTTVGKRPRSAAATFSPASTPPAAAEFAPVHTEDVAGALFRTRTGVLAVLTLSQVSAGRKNRLWFEIDGSRASLTFDQEQSERLWLGRSEQTELLVRDPNYGSPEQRRLATLPAGHAQGYAQCFEAFVADTYAAIRGEAREGLPTFADGLRSAYLVDAVLRSSESHTWMEIPSPPERHPETPERKGVHGSL